MTVGDDAVADDQAKASAGADGLGGEKGLEHVRLDVRRNTGTVVHEFNDSRASSQPKAKWSVPPGSFAARTINSWPSKPAFTNAGASFHPSATPCSSSDLATSSSRSLRVTESTGADWATRARALCE